MNIPIPTETAAAGVANFIIQSLIFLKAEFNLLTIVGSEQYDTEQKANKRTTINIKIIIVFFLIISLLFKIWI